MFTDNKVVTAFRAAFIASFTVGFICFLVTIPIAWGMETPSYVLLSTSIVYSLGAFLMGGGVAVVYGLPVYHVLDRHKANTYPVVAASAIPPTLVFALLGPAFLAGASVAIGIATACIYHRLALGVQHVDPAR